MVSLTLLMSGRMMTLAYIHRAGGTASGDPPIAWLMPLIGDAVIGLTGLAMAFVLLKKRGLWVWTTFIVWNVIGVWDALSAFIISITNPWPDFFMLKIMGPMMFFGASAIHIILIVLVCRPAIRAHFLRQNIVEYRP